MVIPPLLSQTQHDLSMTSLYSGLSRLQCHLSYLTGKFSDTLSVFIFRASNLPENLPESMAQPYFLARLPTPTIVCSSFLSCDVFVAQPLIAFKRRKIDLF